MVLSLCLLLVPGEIITTAIQIIGLIILVASLTYVIISIKHNMTNIVLLTPVITTIMGLLMVLYPKSVIGIIPLMVGLWILGKSLFKLNISNELSKISLANIVLTLLVWWKAYEKAPVPLNKSIKVSIYKYYIQIKNHFLKLTIIIRIFINSLNL